LDYDETKDAQKEETNEDYENLECASIDLVNLKIYALLMCIGKPEQKGEVLFDMCVGSANKKVDAGHKDG